MSVEVLLIPLGIIAANAIMSAGTAAYGSLDTVGGGSAETGRVDLQDQHFEATRIQDQDLLVESLQAMGVANIVRDEKLVGGDYEGKRVQFVVHSDRYIGHATGSAQDTKDFVARLDTEVGKILQKRSIELVQQQAQEMGLRLTERTNVDGSVQLVFEEQ